MKNKILVLALIIILSLTVVGCSSEPEEPAEEAAGEWEFDRPIEIIVPFGPGSGTDTTIRAWAPLVEEELGTTIKIQNVEGAGGIKGAEYLANQPADGYTFGMMTPSHTIAAIKDTANFDILNDVVPTVRLVQDSNCLLAGNHTPYNNLDELVEYAKANPDDIQTVGMMSIDGIDAASVQQLVDLAEIELSFIPYGSGAEANAAVMGGHTDMVLTSPFDGNTYLESGDMKGIVVLAEERASNMPDVPTALESGYDATIGPWRGIVAMKGTPQGAIDALEAAAIAVNEREEWIEWKESVALNDREGFATQEEFGEIWFSYYENMKDILGE